MKSTRNGHQGKPCSEEFGSFESKLVMFCVNGEKATDKAKEANLLITLWHRASVKCQEDCIQHGKGDKLFQRLVHGVFCFVAGSWMRCARLLFHLVLSAEKLTMSRDKKNCPKRILPFCAP